MKTFSFTGAKKIVFGRGSFAALPEHIAELKILRPLIVLDRNLAETGFREKVDGVLAKAGIGYVIYDKTEPEPPLELADEGTKLALKKKCDGVDRDRRRERHGSGQGDRGPCGEQRERPRITSG